MYYYTPRKNTLQIKPRKNCRREVFDKGEGIGVSLKCPLPVWWNGRHTGLKIPCPYGRTGSNPVTGTIIPTLS